MGLICFAGGDTSKQEKSREIEENRGSQGETKGIKGKSSSPSETGNPRTPNEIRGISGIRITFKQWDSPIHIGVL
jgi:hypothetical protein